MTIRDSLTAISTYPVPSNFFEAIGAEVGLDGVDIDLSEVPAKVIYGIKARFYLFLATAPNVSEGGVSISYSAAERNFFISMARRFAGLAGEDNLVPGGNYGYKGENL